MEVQRHHLMRFPADSRFHILSFKKEPPSSSQKRRKMQFKKTLEEKKQSEEKLKITGETPEVSSNKREQSEGENREI